MGVVLPQSIENNSILQINTPGLDNGFLQEHELLLPIKTPAHCTRYGAMLDRDVPRVPWETGLQFDIQSTQLFGSKKEVELSSISEFFKCDSFINFSVKASLEMFTTVLSRTPVVYFLATKSEKFYKFTLREPRHKTLPLIYFCAITSCVFFS